ncbi:MFS transporter, partial [Streptomyces sp. NPDC058953]|uniref:MFS transporter n=1 Tax=Streptomyces sp. NPDC058953 TaxID=3346676 RepID=UPI00369E7B87
QTHRGGGGGGGGGGGRGGGGGGAPPPPPPPPPAPPPLLGTGALLALVHGLLRGAEHGWDGYAVVPLALAAALGGAFLAVEARTADPLVPLAFPARRSRAVSLVAALLFTAAFFAMSFLVMLHLQNVLGYGPLKAGLAYLPYAVGVLTGVRLSSWAVARYGVRSPLIVSFLVSAAGLLMLSGITADSAYATGIAPGVLVAALGSGLGFPALAIAAVADTTERDAGLASALLGSVQQIGGAVGIAALVGLAAAEGFSFALRTAAALVAAAAALILTLLPHRR